MPAVAETMNQPPYATGEISGQVKPRLIAKEWISLAGVLALTFFTYASTISFGWVYDDPPQIPQNPNLQWGRLGFLFTHQLWASTAIAQNRFYRPLLTLWFLIDKTLFGLNPHWFHLTTVLAHVTATALAYFVARSLLRNNEAALFAAAIFGLHPLQVESASWISAVNDPLAAALCFASFLTYREARERQHGSASYWILAAILFACALLTKEVSVVLPGIVLVDLVLVGAALVDLRAEEKTDLSARSWRFSSWPALFAFVLPLAAWWALRSWVLGHAAAASTSVSARAIVLTAPKIFLFNLYRALVPTGLSPQYNLHVIESANRQFLLVALAILLIAALAIAFARRERRLWLAYAWLLFPMLPTLNLAWMNEDDFIHDRYLYMSMLGIALLAGFAYRWCRNRWPQLKLFRPIAAGLVLALAFASAIQSQYWANDVTLFSRAVSRAPQNEWAQLNYASALSAEGKYFDAAPHFVRSYELKRGWRAADFAGFAYQQAGDLSQAEQWFNRALKFNPLLGTAWFGLGQIRLAQHRPERAILYLRNALQIDPTAEGYHYELGSALEQLSQNSAAIEEYRAELQLHPEQAAARKRIEDLEAAKPAQR
jgi:protein O-mannosyl-transferase